MARLILIPSPFTGPSGWRATAERLPDAAAADYGGVQSPDWYEGVARRVAVQATNRATSRAGDAPWIAVLHSGAGGFAPALARQSPDLAGLIFADAILPHPGVSVIDNAPPELAHRLRERTEAGRLRPWNEWFDADPSARLIPDPAARAAFVADLPRTPFAFLEAPAPEASEWEALPRAYLQLSRAYDDTAARAEALGWPVRRERLHHLAMITHPDRVAARLLELAAAIAPDA
ncbi:hypothetical protein [Phenylobacterium sp.]|uniref:hypothetical protein n=1 Tax=Phenylobacterium sp. TaxID=1871053 RepID=UPI00301BC622